jgi:hypothetical protein
MKKASYSLSQGEKVGLGQWPHLPREFGPRMDLDQFSITSRACGRNICSSVGKYLLRLFILVIR